MNDTIRYLKRHLSRDSFKLLIDTGVPMTGSSGLRRYICERDFEAFAKLYFPEEFTIDFAPIHISLFQDMSEIASRAKAGKPGLKLAYAIPRGHSKTSYLARLLPLHGLLYGYQTLTVLLGNTDRAASRLVVNIRECLIENDALSEDFGYLPSQARVWQESHIEVNGCVVRSFGVGSGAVRGVSKPGQRPSLIVADDLDDDASVRSAIELENNINWWDKAVMSLGDNVAYTTSYVAVGTIIRKTSLLSHILSSPDFTSVVEQGVKRFSSRQDIWEGWSSWYLEEAKQRRKPADPASDSFYQEHKTEMLSDTEVLWNRPDAYYQMMLFKLSRGQAAFDSEIQNQPGAASQTLGALPRIKLPTDLSEYQRLAALDPTVKGGRKNDLSAWVEAYLHRTRKELIIAFCDARQRPASQTVDFAVNRLRQSNTTKRFDGLWCESNSAGTLIADSIEQRVQAENLNYNIVQVNNSAPKDDRIFLLSEYAARSQLFVADDIDPEFVNEWESYPNFRWDDALDAAATIVMQLKKAGMLDLV